MVLMKCANKEDTVSYIERAAAVMFEILQELLPTVLYRIITLDSQSK